MTKLKSRDISKKISNWNIDPEVLQNFDNNSNYKKGSPEIIKRNIPEVQKLIQKAKEFYQNGNFINTAKVFRQLAKVTRQIEFDCEVKGDYNKKNKLNDLTGKEWLRHTKSWLVVDGKPSDIPDEIKDHPASYPPDLAKHFIEFFTKKGDWVFDPFMGIGSTLVACMELKRNCWGIELNPKYAEYTQKRTISSTQTLDKFIEDKKVKRVYKIFNSDSRECFRVWEEMKYPKVKFVITSPPYWNILGQSRGGVKSTLKQRVSQGFDEKYSEDRRDLGNIEKYDRYLDEISGIFKQIVKLMVPEGYIMIIIQNVRPKDGIMLPIAWDIAYKLTEFLQLRQEFIWCQDQKFMGIWGYPSVYVSNVHHHYCLVFQTPKNNEN